MKVRPGRDHELILGGPEERRDEAGDENKYKSKLTLGTAT